MQTYYVDKRSGTSADTLLAAGFASLLAQVLERAGKAQEVMLIDQGSHYVVQTETALGDADIDAFGSAAFVRHLDTATQAGALGRHYGRGFPYDMQRQKRDEYQEKRKALPAASRRPDALLNGDPFLAEIAELEPHTLLPLYLVISEMKVAKSFNTPIIRWHELTSELTSTHIRFLLELFAAQPNPLDQIIAKWENLAKAHNLGAPKMTLLQVTNPATGKGANRIKADGWSVGDNIEGFWLLELLKFAGFFLLAQSERIKGSKDRKTYVLRPLHISVGMIDSFMRRFRSVLWSSTPAKLDVLAVLRLVQVILTDERGALGLEAEQRRRRRRLKPADRVHGFDVTFYKDMGSAFAVMNIAALNLPEWIDAPETLDEADRWLRVLKEHIDVIGSIQARKGEERTDEYELLRRYRDFLSGRTIEPFLDFAALFAPYLSRKIERGEYIRRFSAETLEELIRMTKADFTPVITSRGFRSIASAIRRSTVSLQYAKGMGNQPRFEIRYGLAQELVRHADYADDFIAALSDFITRYNNETAQRFETSKGDLRRVRITESDLEEIVQLLAKGFSAKTLARLLVAFGSAKTSRDKDDPADGPEADDLSSGDGE